ncbi:DUF2970 domain-containing protein [Rhodocyclaceae bacterium SMB388]
MAGDRKAMDTDASVQTVRRAGFWATIRAVLWGFLGIRKRSGYISDATSLDPRAIVVAGVLGGVLFVLAIVALVRFVISVSQ